MQCLNPTALSNDQNITTQSAADLPSNDHWESYAFVEPELTLAVWCDAGEVEISERWRDGWGENGWFLGVYLYVFLCSFVCVSEIVWDFDETEAV